MLVDQPYQGRGIGTRALTRLRRQFPGYTWSTSAQYSWARSFWQLTASRSGGGYGEGSACEHIDS